MPGFSLLFKRSGIPVVKVIKSRKLVGLHFIRTEPPPSIYGKCEFRFINICIEA